MAEGLVEASEARATPGAEGEPPLIPAATPTSAAPGLRETAGGGGSAAGCAAAGGLRERASLGSPGSLLLGGSSIVPTGDLSDSDSGSESGDEEGGAEDLRQALDTAAAAAEGAGGGAAGNTSSGCAEGPSAAAAGEADADATGTVATGQAADGGGSVAAGSEAVAGHVLPAAGLTADDGGVAASAPAPAAVAAAAPPPQRAHKHTDRRLKAVRWEERLQAALVSERSRITFGKSGIHGWGVFARVDIPQDAVVTEFRGEVVRPVLADLRERRYRAQGRDCYMFHVNRNVVLDSTHLGHYGRFTNHSCSPSLYTKVLEFESGRVRLAFCARTDIRAGQELTFDYRFKEEEEGAAKVPCNCGAPNCKGTLN